MSSTRKSSTRWIIVAGGAAIVVLVALAILRRPVDDKTLAASMVGRWQAVDPTNAALHRMPEGIDTEIVVFEVDGKLTYVLESKSNPKAARKEPWRWKIQKGKLLLQFAGEGSDQEWLGPIRVVTTASSISIRRKGYPDKEFNRLAG